MKGRTGKSRLKVQMDTPTYGLDVYILYVHALVCNKVLYDD